MKQKRPLASLSFGPDGFKSHRVRNFQRLSTGVWQVDFAFPLWLRLWWRLKRLVWQFASITREDVREGSEAE